ncbi:MAG TPA: hypothetical protein DD979_02575 [Gammaproteobacteria bacterium]|nr:hypothetical protein [Gammaproteobacteria bacterium]
MASTTSLPACLDALAHELEHGMAVEDIAAQTEALRALREQCPTVAQIPHNLGVLKAREQDWPAAIEWLETAIALDDAANETYESLNKIHRYLAVAAYREALQSNSPAPRPPSLSLQDANVGMPGRETRSPTQLRDAVTPLLERWWRFIHGVDTDCSACFASADSAPEPPVLSVASIDQATLPDEWLLLPEAAGHLTAVIRDDLGKVFALQLREGHEGWLIMQHEVLS